MFRRIEEPFQFIYENIYTKKFHINIFSYYIITNFFFNIVFVYLYKDVQNPNTNSKMFYIDCFILLIFLDVRIFWNIQTIELSKYVLYTMNLEILSSISILKLIQLFLAL